MLTPTLYPAIFQRKSIRSYAETPLGAEQLTEIKALLSAVEPLLPDLPYHLELAPAKEGWRIYGYCEDTPLGNANLGFAMQQLDLALHLKNLGRLWFGMGRDPHTKAAPKGQSYAMCLKVGVPAEPLAREKDEFKRKPIEEVIADEALQELFEPVRLAPSARNSQPWLFAKDEAGIHVFCANPAGLMKVLGLGRMNQVDMGICLCHAALAFAQRDKKFEPAVLTDVEPPAGYNYLLTLEN